MKIQTKQSAESLAEKLLAKFNKLNVKTNIDRWKMSKHLYELKNAVAWPITKYNSFKEYHSLKIGVGYTTILVHVNAQKNVLRLKYTQKELVQLSEHFTFTQLTLIISNLEEHASVTDIIKNYKKTRTYGEQNGIKLKDVASTANTFRFVLSPRHTKLFNDILYQNGAVKRGKDGRRLNTSLAMENFLDTL